MLVAVLFVFTYHSRWLGLLVQQVCVLYLGKSCVILDVLNGFIELLSIKAFTHLICFSF